LFVSVFARLEVDDSRRVFLRLNNGRVSATKRHFKVTGLKTGHYKGEEREGACGRQAVR